MGVAREYATQGIRAVDFARAGEDAVPDYAQSSPELIQRFLEDIPMKRFGEPEEIGELVCSCARTPARS